MRINLAEAYKYIRKGRVVAIPTETVYGLACDMYNETAILELFTLKERALDKPFVIQISDIGDIHDFLTAISFGCEKLMKQFWPGSLTLILPIIPEKIPAILRANLPTAGFRIPDHPVALELIRVTGPLVVTSANKSGKVAAVTPEEIEEDFGKDFPILSNELMIEGEESTILSYIDAGWVILRKGAIGLEKLMTVVGYHPPHVTDIDYAKQSYRVVPQLHLKNIPYNGQIKTVLGFHGKEYLGAETLIPFGSINGNAEYSFQQLNQAFLEIEKEGFPHIWVDMDFPKEGNLKVLAQHIERAVRFGS